MAQSNVNMIILRTCFLFLPEMPNDIWNFEETAIFLRMEIMIVVAFFDLGF